MQLQTITPHPAIAPWIHHFWVFQSAMGLPTGDARVVVPNGRPKLIVPWRNGLTAQGGQGGRHSRQGEIVLIGVWDQPSILSSTQEETTTIGVEFKANGLRQFFRGEFEGLFQTIVPLDAYLGKLGERLASRVQSANSIAAAVDLVQDFLLNQFSCNSRPQPQLLDHALDLMAADGFVADIGDIASKLGCSRRHLQAMFRQQAGLSPKRLQAILAFERLYRSFSQQKDVNLLRDEALDIFFDQSHFIRNFHRFTGYTPGRFAELDNEFGRIFYRKQAGTVL